MTILRLLPLPPVFEGNLGEGRNASNNLFRIVIAKDMRSTEPRAAILAQERYEWGYKAKRLNLFGIDRVAMEIMGHAVETFVAHKFYGRDLEMYELSEANSLLLYPQFTGIPLEEIVVRMVEARVAAAVWCEKHDRFIRWALRLDGISPWNGGA